MSRGDVRPSRRPTGQSWLDRKYGGPDPAEADIREHCEQLVLKILNAGRPARLTDSGAPLSGTEEEARDEGRLLYNTGRRLGLSVSSRITDPATGRCELCDGGWSSGQKCQPSRRGGYDLHFSVFAKKDAYKYMLERYGPDRAAWPYDPLAKGGRGGRAASAGTGSVPASRPAGGPVPPDPEPGGLNRRVLAPAGTRRTARSSGSGQAAQRVQRRESLLEKIRRWA
jgi:hypothetical protein